MGPVVSRRRLASSPAPQPPSSGAPRCVSQRSARAWLWLLTSARTGQHQRATAHVQAWSVAHAMIVCRESLAPATSCSCGVWLLPRHEWSARGRLTRGRLRPPRRRAGGRARSVVVLGLRSAAARPQFLDLCGQDNVGRPHPPNSDLMCPCEADPVRWPFGSRGNGPWSLAASSLELTR